MIKILLVDEQASIRRGVRMRLSLEADLAVIGEAGDGWEALHLVRELQPDVVVTGIRLPVLDGIAMTERLRRDFPGCAVVVLSLYDDPINREQAAKAGAVYFISKQKTNGELVTAVRAAADQK
ncbi:MAG: response regulator transcription factor [Ardenticatenaceae bacterium]|nr:response regulator transcription factor [Ardenticatenaceae bacterium]